MTEDLLKKQASFSASPWANKCKLDVNNLAKWAVKFTVPFLASVFRSDCGQLRTDMLISLINEVCMAGILVFTPVGILILPHLYYVNGLCQKHKHNGGAVKGERE